MRALAAVGDWPVRTAAAGVVSRDGTVLGTAGPVDAPFALASVTKPLTAYAVLVAVSEGAIALEDPAGPPGSTVRHLLAHASGLAPDARLQVAAPGTRRIYSNAAIDLAAETVQTATGIDFGSYAAEAVFGPLGMTGTTVGGSPAHSGVSTASDLLVFAAELLSPRLLDPGTVDAACTVAFPGLAGVVPGYGRQDPNDWGLGLEIRGRKSPHWTGHTSSPRTAGHFGRSGTFLWVDPDAGAGCVALTDREFEAWAVQAWPPFTDAVLAELAAGS